MTNVGTETASGPVTAYVAAHAGPSAPTATPSGRQIRFRLASATLRPGEPKVYYLRYAIGRDAPAGSYLLSADVIQQAVGELRAGATSTDPFTVADG